MKLSDITEAVSEESKDIDKMEQSYHELALLSQAFRSGDFGILINKPHHVLTKDDIYHIRRTIKDIVDNNVFMDAGADMGRDGGENLRLLGHRIGHAIEEAADVALAGLFAGLAAYALTNPLTWLLAAAEGGPTAAAAGAFGASAIHQVEILKDMKDAARLLHILDSLENIKRPQVKSRSLIRRIMDKIERKTPKQIESETKTKIRQASRKAAREFDNLVRGLPKEIQYKDYDGEMQSLTIETLFSGI